MIKRVALLVAVALGLPLCVSAPALAQHRSPLADAPAIRKRVEFRATRLELSLGAGSTINQTFNNAVLVNGKLGFHITDWLALSAFGALNATKYQTSFDNRLQQSLGDPNDARAPSGAVAKGALNKMNTIGALQLEFSPFAGKYSLFGKLFANYDFYGFVGPAYVNLAAAGGGQTANACAAASASNMATACVAKGGQLGATFGVGVHSFFNRFVALNVELRDLYFKDNPAGRDVNGDTKADNNDLTWSSNVMVTVGLAFFLPPTPDVTD